MRQVLAAAALAAGMAAVTPGLHAQGGKDQEVKLTVRGAKGAVTTVTGTVKKDSVGGLTVTKSAAGKGRDREVSSLDITEATYTVPATLRIDYDRAANTEKRAETASDPQAQAKDLEAAQKDYDDLTKKLAGPAPMAARHAQFRSALIRVARADSDDKLAPEAIDALTKFRAAHKDCWQQVPATRALARLQAGRGDYEAAARTLDELLAAAGLPKEAKAELQMAAIDALMQGKKFADAKRRVSELQGSLPAGDPAAAARLKVYQIGCDGVADPAKAVAELQKLLDASNDPGVKALAANTTGDLHLAAGRKREALWAYLWVDVVYNQDKQEHLKALERLAKLFGDLNDNIRAEQYKSKLQRSR